MQSNRPSVTLVDVHALHRGRIKARLDIVYDVSDFTALDEALRHARRTAPAALIICDDQGRREDFRPIKAMRLEPAFRQTPIIIILAEENSEKRNAAIWAGATACIAKPYYPSALITLISNALSNVVELRWEGLPPLQAAALKNTVTVFNSVSGMIAAGEPMIYNEITAACDPLQKIVNSDGIRNILQAVREHDNYTYVHSLRVAVLLSLFGRNIGLSGADQSVLTAGGLLLDLGKNFIQSLLLNKSGHLTDQEVTTMRGHVEATVNFLKTSTDLPDGVLVIAGQHHEKLDGSGYPHALKSGDLNELARMAAIVDIFCGLTDRRVYKPSLAPEQAFRLMTDKMAGQLDMGLLGYLRQMVLDPAIA